MSQAEKECNEAREQDPAAGDSLGSSRDALLWCLSYTASMAKVLVNYSGVSK